MQRATVSAHELVKLTLRERQVVVAVLRGLVTKQIAAELGISEQTVKSHLSRITSDLELSGRLALARWAMERPAVLVGEFVEPGLHPLPCPCGAPFCEAVAAAIADSRAA